MRKKKTSTSIVNRRAKFDYELGDQFLAGIVLDGGETKSLRNGHCDLSGSYVDIKKGEAWLVGSHISMYPHAAREADYDPNRDRKLLLTKKELQKLADARKQKLTIVPTKIITKMRYIKVELALAKGRKKHDKREYILKRQHKYDSKNQ